MSDNHAEIPLNHCESFDNVEHVYENPIHGEQVYDNPIYAPVGLAGSSIANYQLTRDREPRAKNIIQSIVMWLNLNVYEFG